MRGGGAGGDLGGDLGAGAEAGVAQAPHAQPVERIGVKRQALGLEDDLLVPVYPEPAQILEDALDMFGATAGRVDILDAQQETPAALPGEVVREQRREGVAEVEPPGRARRETGNYGFGHSDS